MPQLHLGAAYHRDHSCTFTLWAPLLNQAAL